MLGLLDRNIVEQLIEEMKYRLLRLNKCAPLEGDSTMPMVRPILSRGGNKVLNRNITDYNAPPDQSS
jgi:hypothetical protein